MKSALALVLASFAMSMVAPSIRAAGAANEEGLAPLKIQGLDHVYARPGIDLSVYQKIMIDPIEVSFSKNWKATDGAGFAIRPSEKQDIKQGLADVLTKEFTKELTASGRYPVVRYAAEDVLRIRAEIRDLYINAPDIQRPGVTRTYTLSTGEMTLVAELRDSATGALLARIVDRRIDPQSPRLQLTTQVDNIAAAQRAAADWARILRKQLDAAHGIGKKG